MKQFVLGSAATVLLGGSNRYCVSVLKGGQTTDTWSLSTLCSWVTGAVSVPLRALNLKLSVVLHTTCSSRQITLEKCNDEN